MNYPEAQAYLTESLSFGIRLGLDRMNKLVALLNHPERSSRYIHIAGTNGKGSTAAYCASILASAGNRVGVFTSPYLIRLTERIRVIDGPDGLRAIADDESAGEIPQAAFAAAMTQVAQAVDKMLDGGYERPTEFELLTAIAFLHFAASSCDVVVLETGLGGRLDSTNVIASPLAVIITALGYDHMDRLGSGMADIAAEKGGIIKPGCPVFMYNPQDAGLTHREADAAFNVIKDRCQHAKAPLSVVSSQDIQVDDYGWDGQTFSEISSKRHYHTRLLGLFQPMNAELAANACRSTGLADEKAIQDGIRLARWPGRLEVFRQHPPLLIDGAHNLQACEALARTLGQLAPGQPVVFLAGMLVDKDYPGMLKVLLDNPDSPPRAFVCVTPDSPRALSAAKLAKSVREQAGQLHKPQRSGYNVLDAIYSADSIGEGVQLAMELAGQANAPLCAFGSFYLIGEVRRILCNREAPFWTGTS